MVPTYGLDRLPRCMLMKPHHPTGLKVGIAVALTSLTVAVASVLILTHAIGLGIISELALQKGGIGGIVALSFGGGLFCGALAKCYWAARTKEGRIFEEHVEKRLKSDTDDAKRLAEIGEKLFKEKEWGLDDLTFVNVTKAKGIKAERERWLMVAFVWYLMKKVMDTKQGFEKGMIVFTDDNHKIHDFFASAKVAYERNGKKSSHFKSERETSYGIDIPEGLPYVFKHVHFGKLKKELYGGECYTFLKPEQFGLNSGLWDKGAHFLHLCRTVIAGAMGEYSGPNERKEKQLEETVKKELKPLHLERRPKTLTETHEAILALMQKLAILKKAYPNDGKYLQYRKGNEVFIDLDKSEDHLAAKDKMVPEDGLNAI